MKRKWMLFFLLLVALSFATYYATKVKWQKLVIPITATNQDILDCIEKPQNVAKWFGNFKDTTGLNLHPKKLIQKDTSLEIPSSNLLKTEWRYTTGKNSSDYFFKVIPTEDGYTNLEVFYKASWLNRFFPDATQQETLTAIKFLKKYLETPKLFYGIDIENSKVTDTLLLVNTRTIDKLDILKEMEKSYTDLIDYANENALDYTGTRIFHAKDLENDKIDLYTAIGISKIIDTKNNPSFQCSQMPKGNLLVGHYEGTFAGRKPTLLKFIDYSRKFKYQSMAIPFEKILTDGIQFSDSQQLKINFCLPVY